MTRIVVAAVVLLAAVAAEAQVPSSSTPLARQLAEALEQHHTDAIATADPQNPARFIAALSVPGQLLVVGGQTTSPDAERASIRQLQYREVYLDLQTTPTRQGKVFVQDAGADGLAWAGSGGVDIAYEGGTSTTVFDKSHERDAAVRRHFAEVDQEYARMLSALVAALSQPVSSATQNVELAH